jgi:DNA-binding PadR family transcriptional regulator
VEPEPRLHSHLFIPILNEIGPCSTSELEAAVSHLPRKRGLVIGWIKRAREAGIIERAEEAEARDVRGRPLGDRMYRLTMAGGELVEELVRLTRLDAEFLEKLEALDPGQTAESLSSQSSELATEFVGLWMESAYARGLLARTERGEPLRADLTNAGRQRLAGF